MALHFPNASRIYDETRQCVTFWGHDSMFEVAFHLDNDVLQRFTPHPHKDEAASLRVFDGNRARIEHAASSVYSRKHSRLNRLSTSDF